MAKQSKSVNQSEHAKRPTSAKQSESAPVANPSDPKQRFTFSMFFHLTFRIEKPILRGSITERNYLYLLVTGYGENTADQTANLNVSRTISGIRAVPGSKSETGDYYDFIVNNNGHEANLEKITYKNTQSLIQCLNLLFQLHPHLINDDERATLSTLTDKAYLAEAFRISVKNSTQKSELTKEVQAYLTEIYNRAQSGFKYTEQSANALSSASHSIHRQDLWKAGQHWYKTARSTDGRFAHLHISEHLFPQARRKPGAPPLHDLYVRSTSPTENPTPAPQILSEVLSQTALQHKHIYLVGEGGMGKTTSAFSLMRKAYEDTSYSDTCQVPLFLELSSAPDTPGRLYEGGVSTYIRRAIYKQLCDSRTQTTSVKRVSAKDVAVLDEAFMKEPEEAVFPIEDLLSQSTDSTPEYLLILDGLNECSRTILEDPKGIYRESVLDMILAEINHLAVNHPNVRILLTGRVDERVLSDDCIVRLELSGMEDDNIRLYLEQCRWSPDQINTVFANPPLLDTLRVPLFLTLFAPLEASPAQAQHISTRGEIFRIFFHEHKASPTSYTMQSRALEAEQGLSQAASARQKLRIPAKMLYFILDFILPELAWHMVENNQFTLDTIDGEDILLPIFKPLLEQTQPDDLHLCGKYARHAFQKLRSTQSATFHTAETARKFIEIFGTSISDLTEQIFDLATLNLGILTNDGQGNYRFLHQHIRDYFASRKMFNALFLSLFLHEKSRTNLAFSHLNKLLCSPALNHTVRRFLLESLGEHKVHTTSADSPDSTPITRILDIFRGQEEDSADSVNLLIRTLLEARQTLAGVRLDGLDLRTCTLNGVPLTAPGQTTSLAGTRITRETFFPAGHTAPLRCVSFHPRDGGRTILTDAWDNTLKLWDTTSGRCRKTFPIPSNTISIQYAPNGAGILLQDGHDLLLLHPTTGKQLDVLSGSFECAAYNQSGNILATADAYAPKIQLWNTCGSTYQLVGTLEDLPSTAYHLQFHPKEHKLLYLTFCGQLILRDLTHQTEQSIHLHGPLHTAQFTPDGRHILLSNLYGARKLLDSTTLQDMPLPSEHMSGYKNAQFSPDGKKLLLLSNNSAVLWNLASNQAQVEFVVNLGYASNGACFSPDGSWFALSDGSNIKLYDSSTGTHRLTLGAATSHPTDVRYSPDGHHALVSGSDGTARLWDVQSRRCIRHLTGNGETLFGAHFAPNGAPYALTSSRTQVNLWDLTKDEPIVSLDDRWLSGPARFRPTDELHFFFPEVAQLTFANARFEQLAEEEILDRIIDQVIPMPLPWGTGAAYLTQSSDLLATWDMDLNQLHTLHQAEALAAFRTLDASFSDCGPFVAALPCSDGSAILVAHQLGDLSLWSKDFTTCFSVVSLPHPPMNIALSTDGASVVASSYDGILTLFHITEDHRLEMDSNPIETGLTLSTPLSFHPTADRLLLACADGTIHEYDLHTHATHTLPDVPGLLVDGVDLSALHSHNLTAEDKYILKCYGAILP